MLLNIISCQRYLLLKRTIESLKECCLDLDLIDKVILIEDGSKDIQPIYDLLSILEKPFVMVIKKGIPGHLESLDIMFDLIGSQQYAFMCEDDWEFRVKGHWIRQALQVLESDREIKQFLFRIGDIMYPEQREIILNDFRYIKYLFPGPWVKDGLSRPAWPGWNLNPSIWKFNEIKQMAGKIQSAQGWGSFEFIHSTKLNKAGCKVAYFPRNICEHIGEGNSAYKINGTSKG